MKFKIKVDLEYEVEAENEDDALVKLEERFAIENTTAEVEFWDNCKTDDVS